MKSGTHLYEKRRSLKPEKRGNTKTRDGTGRDRFYSKTVIRKTVWPEQTTLKHCYTCTHNVFNSLFKHLHNYIELQNITTTVF